MSFGIDGDDINENYLSISLVASCLAQDMADPESTLHAEKILHVVTVDQN